MIEMEGTHSQCKPRAKTPGWFERIVFWWEMRSRGHDVGWNSYTETERRILGAYLCSYCDSKWDHNRKPTLGIYETWKRKAS